MSFKFKISPNHHGRRLDKVIRSLWPEIPLGALMKDIRKGLIRVDGKKAPCSLRLSEGQEVYVPWNKPLQMKVTAVRKPLDTVYRDDDLWIVNKPSDLLSQPSRKGEDSVLTRSWSGKGLISKDFKPALVNRIDRNTSGIVVLALNGRSLRILQEAVKRGKIRKTYLAVVCGRIPDEGRLDFPLLKMASDNTVIVDNAGSPSLSLFRRIHMDEDYSLVQLELMTGRPHQARVHLAYFGYPILGDVKYGIPKENKAWWNRGVRRPLLHARRLILPEMEGLHLLMNRGDFLAPLPEDMKAFFVKRGWGLKDMRFYSRTLDSLAWS